MHITSIPELTLQCQVFLQMFHSDNLGGHFAHFLFRARRKDAFFHSHEPGYSLTWSFAGKMVTPGSQKSIAFLRNIPEFFLATETDCLNRLFQPPLWMRKTCFQWRNCNLRVRSFTGCTRRVTDPSPRGPDEAMAKYTVLARISGKLFAKGRGGWGVEACFKAWVILGR